MSDSSEIKPSNKTSIPTPLPPLDEELHASFTSTETYDLSERGSLTNNKESRPRDSSNNPQKSLLLSTQDTDQHIGTSPAPEPESKYNSVVFQELASLGPLYSAKPLKPKPAFLRLLPHPDSALKTIPTLPLPSINQPEPFRANKHKHLPGFDSTASLDAPCQSFDPLVPLLDLGGVHDCGGLTGVYVPTPSSPPLMDLGIELMSMNSPECPFRDLTRDLNVPSGTSCQPSPMV